MSTIGKIKLLTTSGLLVLAVGLFTSGSALPGSTFYDLKRLQEKIFVAVKTNPVDRGNYYSLLLDVRLNELKAVVENRQFDYLRSSSLRYSTTAGLLTELIISRQVGELVPGIQNKFLNHQRIFQKLFDSYPFEANDFGKFIQDDYNYLEIYSNQLNVASVNK